jgi:hypothetical protein
MRRHAGAPNGTIRVVPPGGARPAAAAGGGGGGGGGAAQATAEGAAAPGGGVGGGSSSAGGCSAGGSAGSSCGAGSRDCDGGSSSDGGSRGGFTMGPYKCPAGTTVWVPFSALHNSAHNWVGPAAFLPERWLPQAGGGGSSGGGGGGGGACPLGFGSGGSGRARGVAFMPFSDGARSCPGKPLALLELRLALMEIASAFEVSLASEVAGPEAVLSRQRATLTLEPEGGLWVRLAPRARAEGDSCGGAGAARQPAQALSIRGSEGA